MAADDETPALQPGEAGAHLAGRHSAGRANRGGRGLRSLAQQGEDGGVGGGAESSHEGSLQRWPCLKRERWSWTDKGRRIAPAASFRVRHGAAMVEPRKSLSG